MRRSCSLRALISCSMSVTGSSRTSSTCRRHTRQGAATKHVRAMGSRALQQQDRVLAGQAGRQAGGRSRGGRAAGPRRTSAIGAAPLGVGPPNAALSAAACLGVTSSGNSTAGRSQGRQESGQAGAGTQDSGQAGLRAGRSGQAGVWAGRRGCGTARQQAARSAWGELGGGWAEAEERRTCPPLLVTHTARLAPCDCHPAHPPVKWT